VPRSIIDTESSRGRLIRRRIVVAVLVVLALALLVAVWQGLHHAY